MFALTSIRRRRRRRRVGGGVGVRNTPDKMWRYMYVRVRIGCMCVYHIWVHERNNIITRWHTIHY